MLNTLKSIYCIRDVVMVSIQVNLTIDFIASSSSSSLLLLIFLMLDHLLFIRMDFHPASFHLLFFTLDRTWSAIHDAIEIKHIVM